jgi:CBS-domain-containing membrane protein
MTPDVLSVTPDESIFVAARLMLQKKISGLPVVDGLGNLVGIVTRANLLHAMAGFVGEIAPSPAADTTIREQFFAELARQPWAPVTRIDITVRNGVVQLSGTLTDERQRQALRVTAENISGVKKVEDHVVWIEPVSGMYAEAPPEEK